MKVEFDPAKRDATLALRGLDMADAALIFEGLHRTYIDDRVVYSEQRRVTIGYIHGRMMVIAWTERDGAMRVISMRKCNGREQKENRERLR